jgi:hypothetical protein
MTPADAVALFEDNNITVLENDVHFNNPLQESGRNLLHQAIHQGAAYYSQLSSEAVEIYAVNIHNAITELQQCGQPSRPSDITQD